MRTQLANLVLDTPSTSAPRHAQAQGSAGNQEEERFNCPYPGCVVAAAADKVILEQKPAL